MELAPKVYVAQGYDFADLAFVLTDDGIVAIDAGTTETNARAVLTVLRRSSTLPITHLILTHAHWDHIGGLAGLKEPGTQVIAQARFADELRRVNETGVRFRYFFGGEGQRRYEVVPDHLISERERLMVGGTEFVLYPVRGGETEDALVIHLPASGVLFVGDAFMPYLGAPFLSEGSAEGLFGQGNTLVEILHQNLLPSALRPHPQAVIPFLAARDQLIQRVYHQRTGYWKPDGEGMEVFAPKEWAAALDLLSGGKEEAFVRSAQVLLDRRDDALALKLTDLGLLKMPLTGLFRVLGAAQGCILHLEEKEEGQFL